MGVRSGRGRVVVRAVTRVVVACVDGSARVIRGRGIRARAACVTAGVYRVAGVIGGCGAGVRGGRAGRSGIGLAGEGLGVLRPLAGPGGVYIVPEIVVDMVGAHCDVRSGGMGDDVPRVGERQVYRRATGSTQSMLMTRSLAIAVRVRVGVPVAHAVCMRVRVPVCHPVCVGRDARLGGGELVSLLAAGGSGCVVRTCCKQEGVLDALSRTTK